MIKVTSVKKVVHEFNFYPVKLRMARAIKGWSIMELSRKSGIGRKTIEKIEKGNCESINMSTFEKLTSVLGIEKDFYLSNIDDN